MKYTIKSALIFTIISYFLGCTLHLNRSLEQSIVPVLKNPTYNSFSIAGERGYELNFSVEGTLLPEAVIFNKVKQQISESDRTGDQFRIKQIHQSSVIDNFKPIQSNLPDGVLFRINDTLYLRKCTFKKAD